MAAYRWVPPSVVTEVAFLGLEFRSGGLAHLIDIVQKRGQGASALRPFVTHLARHGARVGLLCHSYGTVVCGLAAPHLPVTDIAVFGSPGMDAGSARQLDTGARVWAGRASGDWIRYVPHIQLLGLGFGRLYRWARRKAGLLAVALVAYVAYYSIFMVYDNLLSFSLIVVYDLALILVLERYARGDELLALPTGRGPLRGSASP